MSIDLRGTDAWITGGQRGLGYAFARAFAQRGARVHITSRDPDSEAAKEACMRLEAAGAQTAETHALDLTDEASVSDLAKIFRTQPPSVFVHSAHAFAPHVPIVGLKSGAFAASLETNVVRVFSLLRGVARAMARGDGGRMLILGSLATQTGGVGQACYLAEKGALDGLSLALASEFRSRGVTCSVAHPGIVDTENTRERVPEAARTLFARSASRGAILTPDDVVDACLPLLDPTREVPTGQRLILDDGALAGLRAHVLGEGSA